MAKPAYVLLGSNGVVIKVHSTDVGGVGAPSSSAGDLEQLISQGYQQIREVPLSGGQVLIVLNKP